MARYMTRRDFLHTAFAGAALTAAGPAPAAQPKPRLKKAVKYGMIRIRGSIQGKFELIKKLGFLGVEVVWNDFITKPEQLVQYVDDFKSPYVGAYFDCSNMIKYGVPSSEWVRKLGKRMLKFDFKGYSKTKQWVPIGEGDEDWPEIVKALGEIGYDGWATAEVNRGDEKYLRDVAERMDKVLGLK